MVTGVLLIKPREYLNRKILLYPQFSSETVLRGLNLVWFVVTDFPKYPTVCLIKLGSHGFPFGRVWKVNMQRYNFSTLIWFKTDCTHFDFDLIRLEGRGGGAQWWIQKTFFPVSSRHTISNQEKHYFSIECFSKDTLEISFVSFRFESSCRIWKIRVWKNIQTE